MRSPSAISSCSDRRRDWGASGHTTRKRCASGVWGEALRIGRLGLKNFPNDPELSIRHADLLGKCGDLRGAEVYLASLLNSPPQNYLKVGVPADAVRKEGRRLLGVVYSDQRRYAEAEQLLRELLAEYPDYVQAHVSLGDLLLTLRRFDSVAAVIERLAQAPEGDVYAWVLQAELHLVRGEWERARSLLGQAIAGAPRMLWPRLVLSDCLLKIGDQQGFLAVQRDILRLDPGNMFAMENLRRMEHAAATQLSPDRPLNLDHYDLIRAAAGEPDLREEVRP